MNPPNPEIHETADDNLEQILASDTIRGPRDFLGRPLAKYSLNTQALVAKVLGLQGAAKVADALEELARFPDLRPLIEPRLVEHDFLLLEILADAWCEDDRQKAQKRRSLLAATDDTFGYREKVFTRIENLDRAEATAVQATARKLVQEILDEVEAAKAVPQKKMASPDSSAAIPPTTPTTISGPSPEAPAGAPTTSAGT